MKNTAKTLTLTAKKAPAKSAAAQLAVPKTATSYFLETEAAAKVTVVKRGSRLASLKAQADNAAFAEPVAVEVAEVAAPEAPEAPAAVAAPEPEFTDYQAPSAAAAAPAVVVRKRGSKLAALKTAEEAPVAPAAAPAPAKAASVAPAAMAEDAPKVVRARTVRRVEPAATVIKTGGSAVSQTTDAAALAAIDTTGYLLPQVKVPGRRGRKPSEFTPENDEVAALNAVERAELKAVSKARERKAKGMPSLGSEQGFSETELEKRRTQFKNLINMGKRAAT